LASHSSVRNTVLAASQNYGPTAAASATDPSDTDDDDDDDDDDDSDVSEISSVMTSGDALPGFTTSLLRSRLSGFLANFTIISKLVIVCLHAISFILYIPPATENTEVISRIFPGFLTNLPGH